MRDQVGSGHARSRARRRRGFTLIEVLVASSIGVLLTGALIVALYQVSEVSRSYQDTMDTSQQLQSVATILNHDAVAATSASIGDATLTLLIPTYTFGQVGEVVTQTITYRYVAADGTLRRETGNGSPVVARKLSGVVFSSTDSIDSSGIITAALTSTQHGQQAQTTLVIQRRPVD